jgi:hypothetical protein
LILGYAFDFDNVNAYSEESGAAIKRGSGSVLEDKTLLRGSAKITEKFLDEANSDPVVEPFDIFGSSLSWELEAYWGASYDKIYDNLVKLRQVGDEGWVKCRLQRPVDIWGM